ncbi:MAG: hypothetical protein WC967_14660, partial [Balneolaceae bacterium]
MIRNRAKRKFSAIAVVVMLILLQTSFIYGQVNQYKVIAYDSYGNAIEVEDAMGVKTKYYYGSNSQPFSQIGLNGVKGIYLTGIQRQNGTSIDGVSGGVRPSTGDDLFTEAEYDGLGRVSVIIDKNGQSNEFTYDSFGRLKESYNAHGVRISKNEYYYSLQGNSNYNPMDPNRVESWTYYDAGDTSKVIKSVSYLDGLGRGIQSQVRGGNKTIITGTKYNERGLPEAVSRPIELSNQATFVPDLFEGTGTFAPEGLGLGNNS